MPKCSVVIPTHDTPIRMVRECLESLTSQTEADWECILVADGCDVGYLEELDCLVRDDSRFRPIHLGKNLGVGPARNAGIAECSTDIVVVMDSDDWMSPNRLEWQLEAFRDDPEISVCGGNSETMNKSGFPTNWPTRHPEFPSWGLVRDQAIRDGWLWWFTHGTLAYRKSAVLGIGGYGDRRVASDVDLGIRLLKSGAVWRNLQDVLIRVRRRSDSVSSDMDAQRKAQSDLIGRYFR